MCARDINVLPDFAGRAYLKEWSLTFFGTSINPDRRKKKSIKSFVNRYNNNNLNSNNNKQTKPSSPTTSTVRRDPQPFPILSSADLRQPDNNHHFNHNKNPSIIITSN